MDLYIECPICEQQFSTPRVPRDQPISCPSCSRKFPFSSALEITPPEKKPAEQRNRLSRLEVPANFENPILNSSNDELPMAQSAVIDETLVKRPILSLQRKRRSQKRLITTLLSFAILATIIGVLAGLLIKQLKDQPIASNGTSGTVLADPVDASDNADPDGVSNNPAPNDETDPVDPQLPIVENEKPIPPEEIPLQKFDYLAGRSASDRWNAVQPHLVSLKVFDGLGTHDAVGTIVDSRGWILTSYQAVKGASKIEVKASVKSIDDYWNAKPLTDLVRGYIAEKKADDLVLLSINRRFIVAFSMVQPATENKVVQSEFLLQCAPPSRDNLYGYTETKIVKRSEIEGLDSGGQSRARQYQLDGTDLVWLVATGPTPPLPGTPLFKIDGELAAINVFNADQQNYFLPVDQVKSMIAAAEDDVKPLRELGGTTGGSGPVAVLPTSVMYEPSVRLNRLAESCKVFNWIPQTREDYNVLQEFAEAYCVIEAYARETADSTVPEEQKIVAQKNQLTTLIRRRVASLSIEDELLLAQMNKDFAGRDLQEADRLVPFFGEVHYVDIVNEQLILKLFGTEFYAKAPFVPSDDPMRMQTKWMFFARTPTTAKPINYRISDSEVITAEPVEQLLNFGEQ